MYIDNDTLNAIIGANRDNALICIFTKLLWHTGARLVEVLDTVPMNISLSNNRIRINNRRKRTREHEYYREIDIPQDLIEELTIFIKNNKIKKDEKIFKFTPKTAINYIHIACNNAGLEEKITPKMFRYSFAQNRIMMGVDDFELSYLLGNTDIKKTILYRNLILGKHIA
ncbi:tyrosine-type recombinase/integrase [uncultured Tissierella sp.]|uniref:tyrosine-type recombinase/integrase n=1 Tax=uncultured Tissierella sp. TaxID=448160 RepID=UPI0028040E95|nr:tyrosine-type recombinase/integrase [uncultured Tissierella sp.]MDU5080994.1 tyrosine-type recombinase/integrase [Bacillota bacterium]